MSMIDSVDAQMLIALWDVKREPRCRVTLGDGGLGRLAELVV